jgi:hypothetical protein
MKKKAATKKPKGKTKVQKGGDFIDSPGPGGKGKGGPAKKAAGK